jgi:drug/metabolite transporter (DMT)-like permease
MRPVLGILLTLLSAASFGINNAAVRRGVITGSVNQAVAVSMPIGLAVFAAVALVFGQLAEVASFSSHALLMLAGAGLAHFVFGRYCAYRSIQAMGTNLSAPVTQWSLMVSLVLAVVFLDEKLDLMKLIGIGLLVLGPGIMVAGQRARGRAAARNSQSGQPGPKTETETETAPAPRFKPKLVEGYTFGILSCFGWGSSPILVRAGLEGNGLALAGGVVSYAAATLVIALLLLLPGPRRDVAAISPRNLRWFTGTSVMTCISQIFLYMAMAIAPVTVVQPLMRFQSVFGTLGGWMLNREHEVFDPSVLWAIAVSIVGAMFLALDAGSAMQWLGAPPSLTAAFTWSWP